MTLPDPLLRTKRQRPSSAETHDGRPPHHLHNSHYFPTSCPEPSGPALPAGNSQCYPANLHLVQFYDDESHLHNVLADFFAPFLVDGDSALEGVVLARQRHIHYLGNRFVMQG